MEATREYTRISNPDDLLPLLYHALTTPLGVRIPTSNPQGLREMISRLRAKHKDPLLSRFRIETSATRPTEELWLVLLPEHRTTNEAP